MARFRKICLTMIAVLPLGTALASSTPASAHDAGPFIAGALGGFAAGAIIGSTLPHGGYPAYYGGYYGGGYDPYYAYTPVPSCYSERRPIYDSWGDFIGYRRFRICN